MEHGIEPRKVVVVDKLLDVLEPNVFYRAAPARAGRRLRKLTWSACGLTRDRPRYTRKRPAQIAGSRLWCVTAMT